MQIVLRQLNGPDQNLEIDDNDTLAQLYDKVVDTIQPAQYKTVRLLFRGRDLQKSSQATKCVDNGIENGVVLHMLLTELQQPLVIGAEEYVALREMLQQAQIIRTDLQRLHSMLTNSTTEVRNPPPELSSTASEELLKENLLNQKVQKMVVATIQHVVNARKEMDERDLNLAQAALQGNTTLLSTAVLQRRSNIMASLHGIGEKLTTLFSQYNRLQQTGALLNRASMRYQSTSQPQPNRRASPEVNFINFEVRHVDLPEHANNPFPQDVQPPPEAISTFSQQAQNMFTQLMTQNAGMNSQQAQQFSSLIATGLQSLFQPVEQPPVEDVIDDQPQEQVQPEDVD